MAHILTVAIPAYNVEKFLEVAVLSVAKYSSVEVLIVDDGSTDGTSKIADVLANQFKNVSVIHKKNGGHGSTINAAIAKASGKYFKLLDGDDWFDKESFGAFLNHLKSETADLVLNEHIEEHMQRKKSVATRFYAGLQKDVSLNLADIKFKTYGPILPNTTIRTSILKAANFKIDEHCFYVDQEYNFICYVGAETCIIYDIPIYHYRLEQDTQSVARGGYIKNVASHRRVCERLLREYSTVAKNIAPAKLLYIEKKVIVPLCNLQYDIAIRYCRSRKEFLLFDQILAKHPYFYKHPGVAGNIISLHRKTRGLSLFLDGVLNRIGQRC